MPLYHIVKYDYSTKIGKSEEKFRNKSEALNALYDIALNFIGEKDGTDKVQNPKNVLFNRKDFRSGVKAGLKPGHYMVRDPENHVYAIEIWLKKVIPSSGWIYSSTDSWNKVFDLDIIEIEEPEIRFFDPIPGSLTRKDIESAKALWGGFNKNLESSEVMKKIRNSEAVNLSISELQATFPGEFGKYLLRKSQVQNLLSESTIFETNSNGTIGSYKIPIPISIPIQIPLLKKESGLEKEFKFEDLNKKNVGKTLIYENREK